MDSRSGNTFSQVTVHRPNEQKPRMEFEALRRAGSRGLSLVLLLVLRQDHFYSQILRGVTTREAET